MATLKLADRIWLTPAQVGALLGFSSSFVLGEIKAGELPAAYVKPRGRTVGRWKIHRDHFAAYAEQITGRPWVP